jgi:hypothetical protein
MRCPICDEAELQRTPGKQRFGGLLVRPDGLSCPNCGAEAEEVPSERLRFTRIPTPYSLPIGSSLDRPVPLAEAQRAGKGARDWLGLRARVEAGEPLPGETPSILKRNDTLYLHLPNGRLLRYVFLPDGRMVNSVLVDWGYAVASAYPPDVRYQDLLTEVQEEARKQGNGMWALPTATARPAATAVPVASATSVPVVQPTQVLPTEPPAPAEAVVHIVAVNKRDEYVDIRNDGGQPQDLSGWHLLSERGSQDCALGGVLNAGETLRIWAMAEDEGKGGYNCGFGSNIWNNSERDPAVLFNAAGQEVDRK